MYLDGFDFSITSYCQARCRSCARTNPDTGETADWLTPHHMSLETFQAILENSSDRFKKANEIIFCGELGDPMMHPQIEEFLDVALEYFDYVIVNTNGGLRQPKWYAHAAEKYNGHVRIDWGIDGMDQETNNMYREGVNWKRAMDNMTAWFTNGGSGKWEYLIFDWNWHHIKLAIDTATKNGWKLCMKFNSRTYGLISDTNKRIAMQILEDNNAL